MQFKVIAETYFIICCLFTIILVNKFRACFQLASLLASGHRPISAVVTADLSSICEKISRSC